MGKGLAWLEAEIERGLGRTGKSEQRPQLFWRVCLKWGGPRAPVSISAGIGETFKEGHRSPGGVAPFNQDSGKQRGHPRVWGGRAHVRAVLYMATVAAVRCNAAIRSFYRRLRHAGKPVKVALVACMLKLLVILNVMVQNSTM